MNPQSQSILYQFHLEIFGWWSKGKYTQTYKEWACACVCVLNKFWQAIHYNLNGREYGIDLNLMSTGGVSFLTLNYFSNRFRLPSYLFPSQSLTQTHSFEVIPFFPLMPAEFHLERQRNNSMSTSILWFHCLFYSFLLLAHTRTLSRKNLKHYRWQWSLDVWNKRIIDTDSHSNEKKSFKSQILRIHYPGRPAWWPMVIGIKIHSNWIIKNKNF